MLQFSDRQLQLKFPTDREDYGCSKIQSCPKLPQNEGFSLPNFVFLEKEMSERLKYCSGYHAAVLTGSPPVASYYKSRVYFQSPSNQLA